MNANRTLITFNGLLYKLMASFYSIAEANNFMSENEDAGLLNIENLGSFSKYNIVSIHDLGVMNAS